MSKLRCMVGILVALIATTALLVPVGASAAEPTNFAGVRKTLSREIPEIMKDTHTVGLSIALVDGERTVWARGFGSANRAQKVPVTGETLFQIGSTSKSLAAVAVMQLVEQGKVDLDAPLSRYVPQFKMLPRFPGSVVTLRNVLDMHSGIPGDIYNGAATTKPYPGFDNLLLRILAKTYPQRPVNTTWAYSNSGYSLLRNVVENVTGQGFVAYTHQHLFAPMGMNRTTFDPAAAPVGDLAVGYQTATGAKGGVRVETPPRVYLNCWASGSVVSSASEMASYLKTMIAHGVAPEGSRVLARSTLRQMTTPQTHLPLDITSFKAGLGLWVGDSGNRWMGRALYWNGDTPTFHTFFRWLPELGLGVFVSVNTTTTAPVRDEVGLRALGLMVTAKTGRAAPKPAQPAPVVKASPARLRRAAGQYASSAAGLFTVSAVDGHLKLAAQGPLLAHLPPVTLLPRADGWYAAAPPAGEAGLFEMAWYKPATVAGRHLLLAHFDDFGGPMPNGMVTIFAEKIPSSYRIPGAWRDRVGAYRATNYVKYSAPDLPRTGELKVEHGLLTWNGLVVSATGSGPAFTIGLAPWLLARAEGEAIIPFGETLSVLGVTYRKVGGG